MFTGIIEEIGVVKEFKKGINNASITVSCKKILEDLNLGDSISINGVCQTVTSFNEHSFSAQISEETLKITTLSSIKTGDMVNLERALTINKRMGGHIVSGHVDGISKIKNITKKSDFYDINFEISKELAKYIVKKGSITINGISLTVAEIKENNLNIAIIPHTFENTTLKHLKTGDFVNIEVDILAKYIEKFLSTDNNKNIGSKISEGFLAQNGFF